MSHEKEIKDLKAQMELQGQNHGKEIAKLNKLAFENSEKVKGEHYAELKMQESKLALKEKKH